jgi:hypothetical protein
MNLRRCIAIGLSLWAPLAWGQIVDRPVPVVTAEFQPLSMWPFPAVWLDKHTLAVTTNSRDDHIANGRVVAIDARSGKTSTLLSDGYLYCAVTSENFVGGVKGSMRKTLSRGAAEDEGPHKEAAFRWDPVKKALIDIPPGQMAGWSVDGCEYHDGPTRDMESERLDPRRSRYLRPGDGMLSTTPALPVTQFSWQRKGKAPVRVDTADVLLVRSPEYFDFNGKYLLAYGTQRHDYVTHTSDGRKLTNTPALLMDRQGNWEKLQFPESLKNGMKAKYGETIFLPSARGLLVHIGMRPADGGGVFLVQGEKIERLVCTGVKQEACFDGTPALSPDGCSYATTSRTRRPYVVIVNLCTQ